MVKCVCYDYVRSGFSIVTVVPAGVEMDRSFRHASFQIFSALQFSGM